MNAGDTVSFDTRGGTYVRNGTVLSVDEYCALPLRVEYWTAAGDKRIERFHPSEFKSSPRQ